MALIDTINMMKKQGMNDDEIARNLQEQGYSPQEITNSISQVNIKPASPQQVQGTQESFQQNMQEMQPSMMSAPQASPIQQYQQTQQPITQELTSYPQPYPEEAYSQAGYEQYPQEQYPQQGYEEYLPSTSDTMTEIAEEIVEEKLRKINKAISSLTEIKIDIDSKISNLSSRLKRIENIIDKLNSAILKKVSMYGDDLADIKSELTATQESFSKIINPLVDKARKAEKKEPKQESKHKKSRMEHYLKR